MRRGDQSGISGLDSAVEIDQTRFEPLHACAELVDRFAEFIELFACTAAVDFEVSDGFFEVLEPFLIRLVLWVWGHSPDDSTPQAQPALGSLTSWPLV